MSINKSSLVQTFENDPCDFENDSCDSAWEFYKAYYDFEGSILWDKYHVEKPIRTIRKDNSYLVSSDGEGPYAFVREGNECCGFGEGDRVLDPERLRGNVDFNLLGPYKKPNGQWVSKADRLIEIAGGDAEVVEEVEKAKKLSRKCWNHSPMLSTGCLQIAQSMGLVYENPDGKREYEWLDRPDSLVYLISKFYGNEDKWKNKYYKDYCGRTVIADNIEALADYLTSFGDIYGYCKQIYGIDDELVNRMIELGRERLKSKELVLLYLKLANYFWDARASSKRGKKAIGSLSGSEEVESE